MELGMFTDYCVEWNEAHGIDSGEKEEEKETVKTKDADQGDWDALLG